MVDVVSFKRKKSSKSAGRKRARRSSEDDDEGEEQVLQSIEEVLEDQRLRAQLLRQEFQNGGSSTKRSAGDSSASTSSSQAQAQYGLHDPKKDGSAGQKLLNLLDGQFTGQSTTTQKDQHEELLCVMRCVKLLCQLTLVATCVLN